MTGTAMDESDVVIELVNVSKIYKTYQSPKYRLLELITGGRKSYAQKKHALDNISLRLTKGARLGVIGVNGSGKSTLLKILAGVLTPTTGKVTVKGRVSALLELGAGFNAEISGRENISQFCMLHGMSAKEIAVAIPEIIQFSELEQAIDNPVKTYSSGMAVRLGFSCAVYVKPDILIVDEALGVGDAYFQNKCLQKIRAMLDDGITFIYVTHAADSIRSLCEKGLWLENGKVHQLGDSIDIGASYQSKVYSRMVGEQYAINEVPEDSAATKLDTSGQNKLAIFKERVKPLRTGSGEVQIDYIAVVNADQQETDNISFDQQLTLRIYFHLQSKPASNTDIGVAILDANGTQLMQFSSLVQQIDLSAITINTPQIIDYQFKNPLCPGEYGVEAGIATLQKSTVNESQYLIEQVIDFCSGATRFSVQFPEKELKKNLWGLFHTRYTTKLSKQQ